MGVPEARMNRSRKGSRLCLNSTRLKDISGEVITVPDSAPSSPELRNDNLFTQSSQQDSSQSSVDAYNIIETSSSPPAAPVASFYNLGNTCFMNCMLHVLRFTPAFLQLLGNLREEINKEEKMLTEEESSDIKCDGKLGWDMLRNMHDMYSEMGQKECHYKQSSPSTTESMAVRPLALLESIRLLNPLFEGNMQHDAQELLRCLLCGLDDAEQELRRIKLKRIQDQEQLKESDLSSAATSNTTTLGPGHPGMKVEATESEKNPQRDTRRQPALKGGRRRSKKTESVSSASKGILASFLKAKEVPGIVTKVSQQREPIEGVGMGRESNVNVADIDETQVDIGSSQGSVSAENCVAVVQSPEPSVNKASSPLSRCRMESSSSESDVIYCGESSPAAGSTGQFGQAADSSLTSSSSSPSQGHESYLNSVKHTEGRRSRLGVRGKARTSFFSDKELSPLTTDIHPSNTPGLPSSSLLGKEKSQGSEKTDFGTNGFDRLKTIQNVSTVQDRLSAGMPESPKPSLERNSELIHSSLSEGDKITELTETCDLIQPSLVEKTEWKEPHSPPRETNLEAEKPFLEERSSSLLLLSPGKELTIHSPVSQQPVFYTPQPLRSRNFFSRLGHFLPNSARRFLSFSTEDSQPVGTLPSDGASLPSLEKDLKETALLATPQSVKSPDSGVTSDQAQDCLRKAHIQLRRCDWLGVSPVKPISAKYVMKQASSLTPDSHSGIKRSETTKNTLSKNPSLSRTRKRPHVDSFVTISSGNNVKAGELGANCKKDISFSTPDDKESDMEGKCDEDAVESKCLSRAKKFKGDNCNIKDLGTKDIERETLKAMRLPKLSINLEKCDWLMNSGEKSVKISSSSHQGVKVCKKEECSSSHLKSNETHSLSQKVEASVLSSTFASSSMSGQPDQRLVYNLFGGSMSHQTRCCECEGVSDRSEEFLDISIPVPKAGSSFGDGSDDENSSNSNNSVSLILQSLASREKIYGENKYFCENCQHLVEAERSCHVTSPPKVLALHLKRFHANSSAFGGVSKINDHVAVPRCLPCLLNKCPLAQPTCQHGYSLYAIVTHSGASIQHGHYRTYVRVPFGFSHIAEYEKNLGREPPNSPCPRGDIPTNFLPCDSYPSSSSSNSASFITKESECCDKFGSRSSFEESNTTPSSFPSSGGGDADQDSCWWLECDDDFVQVYEEEEFFGKLSETDGYLLGTPYVLFYHQTAQHRNPPRST